MLFPTRWLFLVLALTACLVGPMSLQGGDKSSAKPAPADVFFNGKDFDGWEGLMEYWKIKDGAIIGATPKGLKFNTFLCSKRKYGDFEMKFQVKLTKTGNSGVQIRSHIHDAKKFAVTGPQADMGQQNWGGLYGENFGGMIKASPADLVKRVLKEEEFNDYYIKARGKRITIKLNGATTVDGEFAKTPDSGIIALQLHQGEAMEVIFRNIQFTEIKKE